MPPSVPILTLSFSGSPPRPLSLSLSAVAQEGLRSRLGVQAIAAAHRIGATIHTSENISQIHNDVHKDAHTPSVSLERKIVQINSPASLRPKLLNIIPGYNARLSVMISVCLPFSLRGITNSYYHSVSNSIPRAEIAVSLFYGM